MVVRKVAPNLSYHYWYLGIRGLELDGEPAPLVLVRGSEFNHEREITMEDDEGHTGTATTRMSSYRSNATANPSFSDKCRYKEGWEDLWLLLLGSAKGGDGADKKDIIKEETSTGSGIYNYTFKINTDKPQDPYFCALLNGFAKTEDDDAYKYEDCILSEFELSGSNEEAPTVTATFSSNYPKVNQPNIARVIPDKTIFPKSANVTLYISPEGTSDANLTEYPCYLEWSFNVNNNIESVPCSGDDFGESTKVLGNREGTVSITIPWTEDTKHLEKTFEVGAENYATDTNVTSENDVKRIRIVMENGKIGSSNLQYKTVIDIPHVVITSAYSEQSGSDAKQIALEGNIEQIGDDSFITTVITTDLEDLHIDNGDTTESDSP